MGLFVCDECEHVENTATSRYWFRDREGDGRALCSSCDPQMKRWHGKFPRVKYDPTYHVVKNR
jgi:hypothetical protein